MAPKKKQKHLQAPESVRQHWDGGNKKEMSELFRDLNFNRVFWQQFKSMAVWKSFFLLDFTDVVYVEKTVAELFSCKP